MHVPFSFFVLPSPLFSPPCYYLRESGVGGASRVWGSLQPLPSWLVGGGGRGGRGGGGEARGLTEVEAAGIEVRRHKFPIGFTAREKIRKMLDYHFPFVCKKYYFSRTMLFFAMWAVVVLLYEYIRTYMHLLPSLSPPPTPLITSWQGGKGGRKRRSLAGCVLHQTNVQMQKKTMYIIRMDDVYVCQTCCFLMAKNNYDKKGTRNIPYTVHFLSSFSS